MNETEPHDWSVEGSIKALRGRVLVRDMEHGSVKTAGGIIITDDDGKERGIRPRWATVYAVGPDVEEVSPGDRILVSHGRWSRGVQVQDQTRSFVVRMVETSSILLVETH